MMRVSVEEHREELRVLRDEVQEAVRDAPAPPAQHLACVGASTTTSCSLVGLVVARRRVCASDPLVNAEHLGRYGATRGDVEAMRHGSGAGPGPGQGLP